MMNRKQRRANVQRRQEAGAGGKISLEIQAQRRAAARCVERGRHLQSNGRFAEAVSAFQDAVSACPNAAELHGMLGGAFRAAGNISLAISANRRAIEIDPGIPALHNNLGNAYRDRGAEDEAEAAYRRAVSLDPEYADAHSNLGVVLKDSGRAEEAVAACRRAVELAPDQANTHGNLAAALDSEGRLDDAAIVLDKATKRFPRDARLRCQLGRLRIKTGDMAAAQTVLRDALTVDPGCATAYFELSDIKRFEAGDEDLRQMERLAARSDRLAVPDRTALHFALAKAYEDTGRFDDAFDQFECGNRLQRRRMPFDADGQKRLFGTIASVFDGGLLDRLGGGGDTSTLPIFVVGMPRSGTTLIERILGNHPEAHGAGELRYLSDIARRATAANDPVTAAASLAGLSPAQCKAFGRDYVDRLRALDPNAKRIVDKMPSNFLRIGLISVILPNARIIHCRRDPADTCLSCYAQLFRRGQSFSYDLRDLGSYYNLYTRLMDHWRTILPGRVLDVDYETMVAEPEAETRRLLDHCDLSWDPACLQFHTNRSPVQTASASQVRRPIYSSSVARWRRFETRLKPLLETLAESR